MAELKVSRITTVALGVVAVVLGIVFEKQNIAFMVSLAFAIAASANFPVLLMSVLWKDCTTRGAGRPVKDREQPDSDKADGHREQRRRRVREEGRALGVAERHFPHGR